MRPLLLLSLFLVSVAFPSWAQQKTEYTSDFVFKEGIYLSFQDFKNNNPVPITHILSTSDIRALDYLWQVLNTDTVVYYDNLLEERFVATTSIWGFCANNKIHVGINTVEYSNNWDERDWFPLLSIGAYSYFTAIISVTRFMLPTPGAMMPSGGISMYNDPMYSDRGSYYAESVPIQMLLNFSTGNYIQLATGDLNTISPKLMQQLLARDAVLLAEFNALSGQEQKQTSMFYIRKFNQRNPIFFPQ